MRYTYSPGTGNDLVYTASEDVNLYALNTTDGGKLGEMKLGDKITLYPAIVDGTIYIGSHASNLYTIR